MLDGRPVVGIIAEFNPFHSGHRYLFDCVRKQEPEALIVCVMSGDFTQRGECAVYSKYDRTRKALENGADLVLQLPICFSCGAAGDFAEGAVAVLRSAGIIDRLICGSECGDIGKLKQAAVLEKDTVLDDRIREALRSGLSFPAAKSLALKAAGFQDALLPNDILAVSYLCACEKQDAPFPLSIIKRDMHFESAHRLRRAIRKENSEGFGDIDMLSEMLSYRLVFSDELTGFADVTPEMARRIEEDCGVSLTFRERTMRLKSKNITYTRASRALLHILLDIRTADMELFRKQLLPDRTMPYVRVLGVRRDSKAVIGKIRTFPVVSMADAMRRDLGEAGDRMKAMDLRAEELYRLIVPGPSAFNRFLVQI